MCKQIDWSCVARDKINAVVVTFILMASRITNKSAKPAYSHTSNLAEQPLQVLAN
jgi:hypothetical protein